MVIQSYNDIQRLYDKELQENANWCIFVLQEPIEYFNTFLPNRKWISSEDTLEYLSQVAMIYDNDLLEMSTTRRLLGLHYIFTNIDWRSYCDIVDDVVDLHNKNEIVFKPNTKANSIRNPYFKFNTHFSNPEKAALRRKHRQELKDKYSKLHLDDKLFEELSCYDLNEGLLTRDYLYAKLGINRHYLNVILARNEELKLMFEHIREQTKSR